MINWKGFLLSAIISWGIMYAFEIRGVGYGFLIFSAVSIVKDYIIIPLLIKNIK